MARNEKFTPAQNAAINDESAEILVSASAGSGKTTVMVERILRLLAQGAPITSMVVCTFTNAAAADIREKLFKRLESENTPYAAAALSALNLAQISTIDSFCAYLARSYFYCAGIDPSFEVMESPAAAALLHKSLEEAAAARFEAQDPFFTALYEILVPFRNETPLFKTAERLINFARLNPDPEAFLDAAAQNHLKHEEHIDAIREYYKSLPPQITESLTPSRYKTFCTTREDDLSAANPADFAHHIKTLTDFARETLKIYAAKKHKKTLADFCDLSHYALRILSDPSASAEINAKFRYLFVDEFQDVNPLQDAVFNLLTARRFYVGDVKQSIYGFRGSRPSIFAEKARRGGEKPDTREISLNANFRSDSGILTFCNRVFEELMTENFGGVTYAEKSGFVSGRGTLFEPSVVCNFITEAPAPQSSEPPPSFDTVYSVRNHAYDEESLDKSEAEANLAAQHIAGLKTQRITENGISRAVRYGDIAVLLRSMDAKFPAMLAEKLTRLNIPHTTLREVNAEENTAVAMLMNFLRLLNNRRDDIVLAAVMKSVFGGFFTDAELVDIRTALPHEKPFHACLEAPLNSEKLNGLQTRLNRYAGLARCVPFGELASAVCADFDFFKYALAAADGKNTAEGLNEFLSALCKLPKEFSLAESLYAVEKGAVKLTSAASADAVKIMTVHSAKGLEFPFVLLPQLNKQYNFSDLSADCLLHPDLGAVLKTKPLSSLYARARILARHAQLEEELRILYVALTRGIYQTALFAYVKEGYVPKAGIFADRPLDFLYRAAKERAVSYSAAECVLPSHPPRTFIYAQADAPEHINTLRAAMEYSYPRTSAPLKLTVTSLSRAAFDDEPRVYAFPTETRGAETGAAYHRFLETYDFVESFEQNLKNFKSTEPLYAPLIKAAVARAAAEKIRERIAGRPFYRERAFLYRNAQGALIQGVADLLIEQEQGIEIVEYKTGKISAALHKIYQKQVSLYAEAAQAALGKRVVSKSIFSVSDAIFIEL